MSMDFQIGDRVEFGGIEGVVESADHYYTYPLAVRLDNGYYERFKLDGRKDEYHTKPLLNLIERPKRKVTKTITRWVNIYSNGDQYSYTSKEYATLSASSGRIACVEMTGTYEVEE